MKKKRNKPYKPRPQSWGAIQIAIMSASKEEQCAEAHRWLATEAYAALEKLTTGLFTRSDFVTVTKLNVFGYMLALEILPTLEDESRAVVNVQKDKIENAAEALSDIADRHKRTNKFGATGPELAIIRESFSLLDQLVPYANKGETVRAMMRADSMTRATLEKLQRNKHVPEPLAD